MAALGLLIFAGIVTLVVPQPERAPLQWHVMGETFHMTAAIEAVREGSNELTLKVWIPAGEQAPLFVTAAVAGGGPVGEPVRLEPYAVESEPWEQFADFEKYAYRGTVEIAGAEDGTLTVVVERSTGEREVHSTPVPTP